MDKLNFWLELKNRFKMPSPDFFAKLAKWGSWFSGLSATVAAGAAIAGMPPFVSLVAGGLFFFGAGLTATANLPVKGADYHDLDTKHPTVDLPVDEPPVKE